MDIILRIFETVKIKFKKKYINITAKKRVKKIKEHDFSVISNNCWGGFVYQSYDLIYNTPTIGCFFMASDYIKFISNLKKYLKEDLCYVDTKNSKWYNQIKNKKNFDTYPIGRLGDVEIHFLHYNTFEEAKEKWNIRKSRINYKKIIYKFSEMNECTKNDIINFQQLNLRNKICFITKKNKELKNEFTIVVANRKLNASSEPIGNSLKFNVNNYINNIESD